MPLVWLKCFRESGTPMDIGAIWHAFCFGVCYPEGERGEKLAQGGNETIFPFPALRRNVGAGKGKKSERLLGSRVLLRLCVVFLSASALAKSVPDHGESQTFEKPKLSHLAETLHCMESKPLVSIIIASYNNGKYLAEAIESALGQTYKDLEIIVVDDGSTDNTRELVKQYQPKIHYLYQENQGVCSARNTGIKNSKGKYLQFLDADDILLSEKLELQVNFLESNPDYAVCYSDVRYFNNFDRTKLSKGNYKFYSGDILKCLIQENFITIHAPLITRACLENTALFQTGFDSRGDWDLWLRIAYAGYKFYYMEKVLALCRWHGNNMSLNHLRATHANFWVVKSANNYISSEETKKALGIRKLLALRQWNYGKALIQSGFRIKGWREMIIAGKNLFLFYPLWLAKLLTPELIRLFLGEEISQRIVTLVKKCFRLMGHRKGVG